MSGYLLDSHVWFWFLIGSERLAPGLRAVLERESEQCWLSPISVWEIGLSAKRGRLEIAGDYRRWVGRAQQAFPLREAAMNREVAIRSLEVELPHKDPADHFLAATALAYDLTLLTVDEKLTTARWLSTRSD